MSNNAHIASYFLRSSKITKNAHTNHMSDLVEKQKNYVRQVMGDKGWSGYKLANESGVAISTINRFINSDDPSHALSSKTLSKIENASGVPFHPGSALPDPDTREIVQSIALWLAERPGVVNAKPEDFAEAFVSLYDYYLEQSSSEAGENTQDMGAVVDFVAKKLAVNG